MAQLAIEGMSVEAVYDQAVKSGLSQVDAAILVSGWIFENFGKSKRVFNYKEPFAQQEPDCNAQFDRTFIHDDWIDGESVVQAETTAGEDGFNFRFHQIEGDFDALKADMVKAFDCMAEMRGSVHQRFSELRSELNRINQDIHNCCNKGTGPIIDDFVAPNFGGLVNSGMYLGNVKLNEKDVALWQTPQGYMMLPTVYTVGTGFMADPRVQRSGNVARFINENAEIREKFGDGQRVVKKELIRDFGNETLPGGDSLKTNLQILPESASYDSLEALVSDLASHEASALRSRNGASAAAAAAFGLDLELQSLGEAPIERLDFVPRSARVALAQNGIGKMADLAKANPRELRQGLNQAGFEVNSADVAEWVAVASTLNMVR